MQMQISLQNSGGGDAGASAAPQPPRWRAVKN